MSPCRTFAPTTHPEHILNITYLSNARNSCNQLHMRLVWPFYQMAAKNASLNYYLINIASNCANEGATIRLPEGGGGVFFLSLLGPKYFFQSIMSQNIFSQAILGQNILYIQYTFGNNCLSVCLTAMTLSGITLPILNTLQHKFIWGFIPLMSVAIEIWHSCQQFLHPHIHWSAIYQWIIFSIEEYICLVNMAHIVKSGN